MLLDSGVIGENVVNAAEFPNVVMDQETKRYSMKYLEHAK